MLELRDLNGRLLKRHTLQSGYQKVHMPAWGISPGLYLLSLHQSASGSKQTRKVIVERP